jgi:lon-related putative ATP-dependent protease
MPNNHRNRELKAAELHWHCSGKCLKLRTPGPPDPGHRIVGQDRAIKALKLGMEMKRRGYNIFVTGSSGTGRLTTIKQFVADAKDLKITLKDRCYVHNFNDNDQPVLLTLEVGLGNLLRDEMDNLVDELRKNIPAAFERKRFKDERKRLMEHFQQRQQSVLRDFEAKVKERGFEVIQVQVGPAVRPDITPVINSQPVSFEQLEGMVKEGQTTREKVDQLHKDRAELETMMEVILREMRNIERKAKDSLEDLEERFILPVVRESVDEIREKMKPMPDRLAAYLNAVQDSIMGDLPRFRSSDEQGVQVPGLPIQQQSEEDDFVEYRVNVLVDNSQTSGTPFIIESNPRYKNLFGTIEREVDRNGVWKTDFSLIKAGSLIRADGGFLVINAIDALVEQGVWPTLKRTLRSGLLDIQPVETGIFGATSALKPEPVDIDVKVIILGDATIYYLLLNQDDEFKKIFKIRADFDTEIDNNPDMIRSYVNFIRTVTAEENLLPFDDSAMKTVIEYGARLAGSQKKLSARFNLLADILHEGNYWAVKASEKNVSRKDVLKAVAERRDRMRLAECKMREVIRDGTVMIDTRGSVAGQVNGLSVIDLREYMFGIPVRITARTSVGREGVINIEREAEMSGPSYNKGVLIISGYLHGNYAQDKPLTVNASITFEQSYSGVDGDSASSTEIYAILSSLSDVPLRQDLAVTGSVNQMGEIQPVGGINQKIEGFYYTCKSHGLTGTQGVIIPEQNRKDLMLGEDVVEAVKKKKFHVYAVSTIDEGLELLTGMKAGKRSAAGGFEKDSIHARVDAKLAEYARRWKELAGGGGGR